MKEVTVVVCWLVTAGIVFIVAVNGFTASESRDDLLRHRIQSQVFHLEYLERELDKLELEHSRLSPMVLPADVDGVRKRIGRLEGKTRSPLIGLVGPGKTPRH